MFYLGRFSDRQQDRLVRLTSVKVTAWIVRLEGVDITEKVNGEIGQLTGTGDNSPSINPIDDDKSHRPKDDDDNSKRQGKQNITTSISKDDNSKDEKEDKLKPLGEDDNSKNGEDNNDDNSKSKGEDDISKPINGDKDSRENKEDDNPPLVRIIIHSEFLDQVPR